MPEGDKISKAFYLTIMIGTLMAGALNNVTLKQQDDFVINEKTGDQFYHPFVQTLVMFIAELCCLIAFYAAYHFNPRFRKAHDEEAEEAEANGIRTKNNWWIPAIPAVCDITGTCLQMISMSFINQSVYVMMRGGTPIITAVLSIIFLKKVLSKAQYLGLSLAVCGITIVGITSFSHTESGAGNNLLIGTLCCLGSLLTTGIQFVVEEKVLATNHIHPLKMVGLEGLFGIFYTAIVIAIANNIPCTYEPGISGCNSNGKMEDFPAAIHEMFTNGLLLMWIVLNMCSLGFFNFCGMSVTKHVSSLARAILLITTTVLIWIYDLIVIKEPFYIMQLVGFIVLVVGNLIYQKIIKIQALEKGHKESKGRKGSKKSFGKISVADCISHQMLVEEHENQNTLLDSEDR